MVNNVSQFRVGSGKTPVTLSEPYRPVDGTYSKMVGREEEIRLATAALLRTSNHPPMHPILVGPPGTGKTRLAFEIAKNSGQDVFIVQGHEDFTPEDFVCGVRISNEAGEKAMSYVLMPLATAMLKGAIIFVDEIGKIRPRALAILTSLLDERKFITSILLGERIEADPNFRFIAATNLSDLHSLPDFIRSRLTPTIFVNAPKRAEINAIIEKHFPGSEGYLAKLLDSFWSLWRGYGEGEKSPTPREAIHVFALAESLKDLERQEGKALKVMSKSHHRWEKRDPLQIKPSHLEAAFHHLFQNDDAAHNRYESNISKLWGR